MSSANNSKIKMLANSGCGKKNPGYDLAGWKFLTLEFAMARLAAVFIENLEPLR